MKRKAKAISAFRLSILCFCVCFSWFSHQAFSDDLTEVPELLAQADMLILMGIRDLGAGRSFVEAEELVNRAAGELDSGRIPPVELENYRRQVDAVREDLENVTDLYAERFFGVFPLARLVNSFPSEDEGLTFTEQLYHPTDHAAALMVTRKMNAQLSDFHHPHVILRSSPPVRPLENLAAEELLRGGSTRVHSRRQLIQILDDKQLADFDSGNLTPEIVSHISHRLGAVSLVIISLSKSAPIKGVSGVLMEGSVYAPVKVIQANPREARPYLRTENFSFFAFARDRRDVFWPALLTEIFLLLTALTWASRIRWNKKNPFGTTGRLAIGALLFTFGRLFIVVTVAWLSRWMPDEAADVAAAWWWPSLIGLIAINLVGFVAWMGQAKLTNVVPGMRGARAVGTIFALPTLGAASCFITPLLLLDGVQGFANFVPFLIASLCLAMLFGFAARTGPPVPHYFMIFPLLISPLVGTSLFMASTSLIWISAGIALAPCLAAWLRHRAAVARGWEEPEPTADEAAHMDHEGLMKLRQKLGKK